MLLNTSKENLCLNQLIDKKKEIVTVEGDVIVPDIKPDILKIINTTGIVCTSKSEIFDGRIRVGGNILTYITYQANTEQGETRGIHTRIDFSETIDVPNCKEGMEIEQEILIKSIESKMLNERKVSIKAILEIKIKIYSNSIVDIINSIDDMENIQMLNKKIEVNSLVGVGKNKMNTKDTISINNEDILAEILNVEFILNNNEIKVSYNKVLSKIDANIRIMYITEDGRIQITNNTIPLVGFIDIKDVSDENTCDIKYNLNNLEVRANDVEEHAISIEIDMDLTCYAYEKKEINNIQDLYSPLASIDIIKKEINITMNNNILKHNYEIRENLNIPEIAGNKIVCVYVNPNINNQNISNKKLMCEGETSLTIIFENNDLLDSKNVTIPFNFNIEDNNINKDSTIDLMAEVINQNFIVTSDNSMETKIDLQFSINVSNDMNLSIIDEINCEEREEKNNYSLIMYVIKKEDTLWDIAKKFNSTIDDIVNENKLEDLDKIKAGQQIFIPRYVDSKRVKTA